MRYHVRQLVVFHGIISSHFAVALVQYPGDRIRSPDTDCNGRKQTVYDRIRLYLYRSRTVFCCKPGLSFMTVFSPYLSRILIVYRPYAAVFTSEDGRKSSTWFTGRIQRFTGVSAPYSSSWVALDSSNVFIVGQRPIRTVVQYDEGRFICCC
jgi:hypothetical protein